MSHLISVQESLERILTAFSPVETEAVPLREAYGRVLSRPVTAPFDFPPFTNSSMDGFAVIAADTLPASMDKPVWLRTVADIPAGSHFDGSIRPGEAARIMTGAPLPEGADAVVPVESTHIGARFDGSAMPEKVGILQPVSPGDNVRPRGQDVRAGAPVLSAGTALRPQDIGMLASLGFTSVEVHRLPRITVFSTGDELVQPGEDLTPGKIYDSNSYVLRGLTRQSGCQVIDLGLAKDDPDQVRALFEEAVRQQADLILSSAGVSVGAHDYVRQVIESEGELSLWRVNMRPGKPLTFGRYQNVPFLGLAGNPVSAFVGYQVFVLPVLQKLRGLPALQRRSVKAVTGEPIRTDGRESYLRARVTVEGGIYRAVLSGHQGSGNLFSLIQANALLIVPSGVKSLPIGAELVAWLLDE